MDYDTIFLLGEEGRLERIPHRRYDTEDLLQGLIDSYPELLVGEQIDRDQPPRWMMVSREAGIPDADRGHDRWSIDHVLLDQRGLPTLIEVKRSTDTCLRRQVVGQMLDYAANARKYWPQERIRELAAARCGGLEGLEEQLRSLLREPEADIDAYWETVDRNLREGELRLLFVADEIPTELRRIIEFLNEQMPRIEVLGIEIRQYERNGTRVLVPRVLGQTAQAEDQKQNRAARSWTADEVIAKFNSSGTFDAFETMQKLLVWADGQRSIVVETGSGPKTPSFRFRVRSGAALVTFMTFTPADDGSILGSIYFGTLTGNASNFESPEFRQSIADTIKQEIDPQFNAKNIEKYPLFQVRSEDAVSALIRIGERVADVAGIPRGDTPLTDSSQ
jgi:hypothetical protein